jgi:penicillin amidase
MRKFIAYFFLSLFFLLLGILCFFVLSFYHSMPKTEGKRSLPGLSAEVRIIQDDWGVPHVFAQNEKDLYFAFGYLHAQERMWQMDLNRRVGYGRLSEIFGEKTLARDKLLRNFCIREAALRDLERLSSKMRELLRCYARGINTWMNSRRWNWPPEFLLLRFRPEPWQPLDSLLVRGIMALFLSFEYQNEVLRARLIKRLGSDEALSILEEGLTVPSQQMGDLSLPPLLEMPLTQGSNSWVVHGGRTESGKPLLANDPHLEISLPPIWYEVHLNCPTMNVAGASIPGSPLVILGHNPHIGWGMTYSTADCQDLFLERFNASKDRYLNNQDWEPLRKTQEKIKIRGKRKPEKMDVLWTDRGPIVSPLIVESENPVSLSWTVYEGGRTFEAFYLLNKARNWEEFKEAIKLFDAPSHNFVYADRYGNIGCCLSGRIPLRSKQAALFPFPGWIEDGWWQGYIAEEEKPMIFNPEEGFIVNANNRITPEDYPFYISLDWDAPFRAKRIQELLLQREKHSVETFKRIQNDIFSKKTELILPLLQAVKEDKALLKESLGILEEWDLKVNSQKGAALFLVFMDVLHEGVFQDELGDDFRRFDLLYRRKMAGLLRILSQAHSPWFDVRGTDSTESRENIFKISLEKACRWLDKKYGSAENWDWTEMNAVTFRHVLGQSPLLRFFNRGPYPLDGHAFTVKASFSTKDSQVTHGVSYRQIIDLGDHRNSVSVITSGQSGHVLSRCYDDQIPLWLGELYHPMLFSSEDIQDKARGILLLSPLKEDAEK